MSKAKTKPKNKTADEHATATVNGVTYETPVVDGVQRFAENRIVSALLESSRAHGGLDLNQIANETRKGSYTQDERRELYRLIGYSVCGFTDVFHDDTVESSLWDDEA